jgi:hypothetical protein
VARNIAGSPVVAADDSVDAYLDGIDSRSAVGNAGTRADEKAIRDGETAVALVKAFGRRK